MTDLSGDRVILNRLCERLRSVSEASLTRPREALDGASMADAAHRLCTDAAKAAGVNTPVPRLHPLASGDQLLVIGREFLAWAERQNGDPPELMKWRAGVRQLRAAS